MGGREADPAHRQGSSTALIASHQLHARQRWEANRIGNNVDCVDFVRSDMVKGN